MPCTKAAEPPLQADACACTFGVLFAFPLTTGVPHELPLALYASAVALIMLAGRLSQLPQVEVYFVSV